MDPKDQQDQQEFELLFTEDDIQERISELGAKITEDYPNEEIPLVIVPVLTGAMYIATDLSREIPRENIFIEPMSISSYGNDTKSSKNPKILLDLKIDIDGKDVLIVEDIVDTGYSMHKLIEILSTRAPNSLKVCALLSKEDRREIEVPIDYLGFNIPDLWVEGYGLDTNCLHRNLPYIRCRK